jgi:hypothetical protein
LNEKIKQLRSENNSLKKIIKTKDTYIDDLLDQNKYQNKEN